MKNKWILVDSSGNSIIFDINKDKNKTIGNIIDGNINNIERFNGLRNLYRRVKKVIVREKTYEKN